MENQKIYCNVKINDFGLACDVGEGVKSEECPQIRITNVLTCFSMVVPHHNKTML